MKAKLEDKIKGFEGNDDEYENNINRLTKENHDLKRELQEMKVSKFLNEVDMV